jgi:fucose 4-O-acetylase-like acetyltransferase
MTKERIKWLDAAKGLGILLVVFGHNPVPAPLGKYLVSFHMPLFFLVSGYLFGMTKPLGFKEFLRKRIRTLVIPYFAFFLLQYVYFVTLGSKYGETSGGMSLTTPLFGVFYGSEQYLDAVFTPMWFLPCLFTVEVMFFWTLRLFRQWYGLVLVACSVLGFLGSLWLSFRLPWGIEIAFTAIVFYGAGSAVQWLKNAGKYPLWAIAPIPVLLAVNFFASWRNDSVSLRANTYGNYFLFYIAAFTGVFGYILISQLVQGFKPLLYLGKNSLIIFTLHALAFPLIKGLLKFVFKVPLMNLQDSIPAALLFTAACVLVLIPAIYVINKYFYFILGRPRPAGLAVTTAM